MDAGSRHLPSPQSLVKYPSATYSVQTGRISFAPGTRFTRKLQSRVSERALSTTMNIRPLQNGERPFVTRFRAPKATAPCLPASVTGSDYVDPRYAVEYAKWSEIPPWFCRSKSNVLVSDRFADELQNRTKTDHSSNFIPYSEDGSERETETPSIASSSPHIGFTGTVLHGARPIGKSADSFRSSSTQLQFQPGNGKTFHPRIPHYKPLVGEVYRVQRLYPAYNPWRSLQLESEVQQYVEHKKKCQGRTVRFTDTVNVTANEPHVVVDRGPTQRPYAGRRSFDNIARQSRRSSSDQLQPNSTIDEVVKHQGRMYSMQAQLKDMLHEGCWCELSVLGFISLWHPVMRECEINTNVR